MTEIGSADEAGARGRLLAAARAELVERGLGGVSLRGIARRAGVSHAAPQYFFGDRAGLLTAVAADGFAELSRALRAAASLEGASLAVLGRAYVTYASANPTVFELMFRPAELHPDDPALAAAQADAIGLLAAAVPPAALSGAAVDVPAMALVSWAFAHGLVVLTRDGALQGVASGTSQTALLDQLLQAFDQAVS